MMAVSRAGSVAAGLLCGLACLAPPGAAGTHGTAGFQVAVRMAPASQGVCMSGPSSLQTQTVFLVTCASRHFVSMSPHAGGPFAGTHGSAFQFHLMRGAPAAHQDEQHAHPTQIKPHSEMTAMRVSGSRSALDEQVEILVSF